MHFIEGTLPAALPTYLPAYRTGRPDRQARQRRAAGMPCAVGRPKKINPKKTLLLQCESGRIECEAGKKCIHLGLHEAGVV
jgi:hypothetical protein